MSEGGALRRLLSWWFHASCDCAPYASAAPLVAGPTCACLCASLSTADPLTSPPLYATRARSLSLRTRTVLHHCHTLIDRLSASSVHVFVVGYSSSCHSHSCVCSRSVSLSSTIIVSTPSCQSCTRHNARRLRLRVTLIATATELHPQLELESLALRLRLRVILDDLGARDGLTPHTHMYI